MLSSKKNLERTISSCSTLRNTFRKQTTNQSINVKETVNKIDSSFSNNNNTPPQTNKLKKKNYHNFFIFSQFFVDCWYSINHRSLSI